MILSEKGHNGRSEKLVKICQLGKYLLITHLKPAQWSLHILPASKISNSSLCI
jgi:hypothetical protein